MKNKDILRFFKELGKPLYITPFKLWWKRYITGEIEPIFLLDRLDKRTNIIKAPWLKAIFLFEQIESKLLNKKGIFLLNYFLNGNEETLKGEIPALFHAFCLAKQREGHEGIFVVLRYDNLKDIKYFQSESMGFIFNKNENILYQEEFNNPDYLILTKKV
jgi:hypothetical protein